MNNIYAQYSSQLQSRISRRGNQIAAVECWKKGYHALGQLKKFRETKEELAELRVQQKLDKKLLSITQELAYIESLSEAEYLVER